VGHDESLQREGLVGEKKDLLIFWWRFSSCLELFSRGYDMIYPDLPSTPSTSHQTNYF
jgi:hypothetical protein